MKTQCKYLLVVFLALLVWPLLVDAQQYFELPSLETRIEILPEILYQTQFGDNPDVPQTEAEIIALAERLFPPLGRERPEVAPGDQLKCGEYDMSMLLAALQNPAVSDATRNTVDHIVAAATPKLMGHRIFGHFLFKWTENDPDPRQNVTLEDIVATAEALNRCWDIYKNKFGVEPKHEMIAGKQVIRVNVHDYPFEGHTDPDSNIIRLNSHVTVKNRCNRKTTSAHELFHRLQYAFGLNPKKNPDIKWITEGTACWAQKFTYNSIKDYIDWMNEGLGTPDRNLLKRKRDACHFWVNLEERSDFLAIRDVLVNYKKNGGKPIEAVGLVVGLRFGLRFSKYVQTWNMANYFKDLSNAPSSHDYADDETVKISCGVKHGPLLHVPRRRFRLDVNNNAMPIQRINPYGADYFEVDLDDSLTKLKIAVDGEEDGNVWCYLVGIKDNRGVWNPPIRKSDVVFKKTLTPGEFDKVALVIGGGPKGGSYKVKFGSADACLTGTWRDTSGAVWTLEQYGVSIIGNVTTPSPNCPEYVVYGHYMPASTTIELKATLKTPGEGCAKTTNFEGTLSNCSSASGTWRNSNGHSGTWSMSKQAEETNEIFSTDRPRSGWWNGP